MAIYNILQLGGLEGVRPFGDVIPNQFTGGVYLDSNFDL